MRHRLLACSVVSLVVAAGIGLPAQVDHVRNLDGLSAQILSELLDWELDDVLEDYDAFEADLRRSRQFVEGRTFEGEFVVRGGRLLVSENRLVEDILTAFDEDSEEAEDCEDNAGSADEYDECDLDLLDLNDEMYEAGTRLDLVVDNAVRSVPVARLDEPTATGVAVGFRIGHLIVPVAAQNPVFGRNSRAAVGATKQGVIRVIRQRVR